MSIPITIMRGQETIDFLFDTIIKDDGFICGGYARWCCSPKVKPFPTEDIDIYCYSESNYHNIRSRIASTGYAAQFESEVAVSFIHFNPNNLKLQLIKAINQGAIVGKGTPEEIINNFDFTIARCYIVKQDGKCVAYGDIDFTEDEKKSVLHIKTIHCPVSQIYRVAKYMEKGYHLPVMDAIKILVDWEGRDEDYKSKILETLKKSDPTKEEIQQLEALLHID